MLARPGWDTLTDRTGLSRSTIAKYLALFHAWGLLGRVRAGSTRRTRGNHPDDDGGNLAGEYVLCVPAAQEPVEITRTPSTLRQEGGSKPPAHARENHPEPTTNLWPIGQPPATRRDQLEAAKRLQQLPVFRGISPAYVRSILRPVLDAGWTPAQIRYALDHRPDGTAYWHTEKVRHAPAWAEARLAAWRREDGTWATPAAQLGAGRTTDLSAADVAALPRAGTVNDVHVAERAAAARKRLADVLDRARGRQQPTRGGLGVLLPDADGRIRAAAEPEVEPAAATDGGDWLLRNAAAQAWEVA